MKIRYLRYKQLNYEAQHIQLNYEAKHIKSQFYRYLRFVFICTHLLFTQILY